MRLIGYGRCICEAERDVVVEYLRRVGCTHIVVDIAARGEHRGDRCAVPEWDRLIHTLRPADRLLVLQNRHVKPRLEVSHFDALADEGVEVLMPTRTGAWGAPTTDTPGVRASSRRDAVA